MEGNPDDGHDQEQDPIPIDNGVTPSGGLTARLRALRAALNEPDRATYYGGDHRGLHGLPRPRRRARQRGISRRAGMSDR
jgi:hypothetical protein